MMKYLLFFLTTAFLWGGSTFNELLIREIGQMPKGGGYSVKKDAFEGISNALVVGGSDGGWEMKLSEATPSFCSSATYLVFLKAIKSLQDAGQLRLSDEAVRALVFKDEADGDGFWGRWNANGPGVARLFHDLKLGVNFQSYTDARAGDLMKIFWKDAIGKYEHGHLVIYLGQQTDAQGEVFVRFWSSNQPGGYGVKVVPKEKIKWAIFSRITKVKNISKVTRLARRDEFLRRMLYEEFTRGAVIKQCDIRR